MITIIEKSKHLCSSVHLVGTVCLCFAFRSPFSFGTFLFIAQDVVTESVQLDSVQSALCCTSTPCP